MIETYLELHGDPIDPLEIRKKDLVGISIANRDYKVVRAEGIVEEDGMICIGGRVYTVSRIGPTLEGRFNHSSHVTLRPKNKVYKIDEDSELADIYEKRLMDDNDKVDSTCSEKFEADVRQQSNPQLKSVEVA